MGTLHSHTGLRRSTRGCMASALCLAAAATAWAGPSVFPTGTTRYDPSKAYNCDMLFSGPGYETTYLIDMNGNVLHRWKRGGVPAMMLSPAEAGGVKGEIGVQLSRVPAASRAGRIHEVPGQRGPFADLTFGYLDWSGKTVWEWGTEAPGGAALQHHDWARLANGDTLLLSNRVAHLAGFGRRLMLDPVIYEVDPKGRIVWSWRASQHLGEMGFTGTRLTRLEREAGADYLHMNAMTPLGPNRWAASGDARFAPDNILISSRNANFLAIISRKTGRIVWRLGPHFPQAKHPYAAVVRKIPYRLDGFSGQHDAHMIAQGLPGAGDILVFDNEGEGGYPPVPLPLISGSRVLQINPVTREVVWQYTGTKASFFSPFIGSAQRLPNGNTLIDEGIWGRFFQVTPKGRIVWEYVSPYPLEPPRNAHGAPLRAVYRVQAVPYDWLPNGVPHSERAVRPPELAAFHIPPQAR